MQFFLYLLTDLTHWKSKESKKRSVVGFVVIWFGLIFNTQPFWNDCWWITASYTNDEAHVYLVLRFGSMLCVVVFFLLFSLLCLSSLYFRHTFPKRVYFGVRETIQSKPIAIVFVWEISQSDNSCKHCAQPFQHASFFPKNRILSYIRFCERAIHIYKHTHTAQRRCDNNAMEFKYPWTNRSKEKKKTRTIQTNLSVVVLGSSVCSRKRDAMKHSGKQHIVLRYG